MASFLGHNGYGLKAGKEKEKEKGAAAATAPNGHPSPASRLFEEMNSLPEIRKLMEDFRKATGMPFLKLVAPDHSRAFVGIEDEAGPLCMLVRNSKEACQTCVDNQRNLLDRTEAESETQHANCFVGLTEFAVPVMEGRRHVATLVSGQVFLRTPTERDFAKVAARLGGGKGKRWTEKARRIFFGTPVVSAERVDAVRSLLEDFAGHLVEKAKRRTLAANPSEHPAVSAARKYVESSGGEISLAQVLDHVHVSRFHFCKIFRKHTGLTLTEYVNRFRLTKAKELLADHSLRISDAAFTAGFGSIAQFNSLFQREVGMSPSEYRKSLSR